MAWIKVYSELWDSWKIPKICERLKINEAQAIGHLISLWSFTERNAWKDGDLSKWGPIGIAKAGRWTGKPEDFIKAMQTVNLLNGMKIHSWKEHQAGMIHDRERRQPKHDTREIPAESPPNTGLDKMRLDKMRLDKIRDTTSESLSLPRKAVFTAPTLQQVKDYCHERGNRVNPEKFIAYYESNGWRVGRNPMKSWKGAVVTWEHNPFDKSNSHPGNAAAPVKGKYDGLGEKA